MKIYAKDGREIGEIMSYRREGFDLILETRLMGIMQTSLCLKPLDLWKAVRLFLSKPVCFFVPIVLIIGMMTNVFVGREKGENYGNK